MEQQLFCKLLEPEHANANRFCRRLAGNDTDYEDKLDLTSIVITSGPANGSVLVHADGTVTYTPNNDFNGADSFTYTISDGNGGTDTATVTITINGTEDAPVIGGTSTGSVTEDGSLTANGTLTITDVDTSDNPVSFPDEASTLGDNGYGDFALSKIGRASSRERV